MSITKIKLEVYTELKRRLNGKCGRFCPQVIAFDYNPLDGTLFRVLQRGKYDQKFCEFCYANFAFLNKAKKTYSVRTCPCNMDCNPDEIFCRLDECLEELKSKLEKEYSS